MQAAHDPSLPFTPWRPLSIESVGVLTEDVDRTIEAFRYILKERPGDVPAAKEEMERKMATLFDFKKQHHNDERVVVVELLRLKLRKALRETTESLQRQSSKSPTSFQLLQSQPKQIPSQNGQLQKPASQSQISSSPNTQLQKPASQSQISSSASAQLQKPSSQNFPPQNRIPSQKQVPSAQEQNYAPLQTPPSQKSLPPQQVTPQIRKIPSQQISQQNDPQFFLQQYQNSSPISNPFLQYTQQSLQQLSLSQPLYAQTTPSNQPYYSNYQNYTPSQPQPYTSQPYIKQSPPQTFQKAPEQPPYSQPPQNPTRPRSPIRLPMQLQHIQPQQKPQPPQPPQPCQNFQEPQLHTQPQYYPPQYPPHYQYSQYQTPYNSPYHPPVRLPMQLQQQHQKQQPYQPPPIMLRSSHNDTELSLFPSQHHPHYPATRSHPTSTHYYINSAATPEPSSPPTPTPYPQPHAHAPSRYDHETASQTTALSGYEEGSERGTDYASEDDVRSEFSTTSQNGKSQNQTASPSQSQLTPRGEENGRETFNHEDIPTIELPNEESERKLEVDLLDPKLIERPQSKLQARIQAQVLEKEKKEKEKLEPPPKKKAWRKLQKPKPRVVPKVEQPKDPKNLKPLYEWEVRNGAKPPPVKNITQSLSPTSPLSRAVEFKIVLTPAEFEQLQEKRNAMARSGMVISPHTNFVQKNTGRLAYSKVDPEKTPESVV